MKKTVLILTFGLLLIGINLYAADGDLIVNGKLGLGTASPELKLSLDNDGGIIAKGTTGSGTSLTTTGAGTRLLWYPRKAAFRAGEAAGSQWDDANIGNYSVGFGYNPKASGAKSVVFGNSVASGTGAIAMGEGATVSGAWSVGITQDYSVVNGNYGILIGYGNVAGSYGVGIGWGVSAAGSGSTAVGFFSEAKGGYSAAVGSNITASASKAIVIGNGVSGSQKITNNIANSIMLGNNSTIPTLVIGPSAGAGTSGNVGIGTGTTAPTAKLQVAGGDAAVTTQGNGVILKATDGANCFRVTVNNTGTLQTAQIACP